MTMAKKKKKESGSGNEMKSLTREELQNMKFRLSINIPKADFDKLVKWMLDKDK